MVGSVLAVALGFEFHGSLKAVEPCTKQHDILFGVLPNFEVVPCVGLRVRVRVGVRV